MGTFHFTSDEITSTYVEGTGKTNKTKLRLRTGGSSASVKREQCTIESDHMSWNINGEGRHARPYLPVRYRYRSPILFEFHVGGKRSTNIFAALWLQGVVDGEEMDFDIPIFRCDNGTRFAQNYITEENFQSIPVLEMEQLGRLRFRGRFKAGTDRHHKRFVSDNDSRETIETWEACYAEGVRKEEVSRDLPPVIQKLHDDSLTQGRDVLATASEEEKQKWLAKDGTDWTGAFGKDPADLMSSQAGDGHATDEDVYVPEEDSDEDSSVRSPASPVQQRIRHEDTDLGVTDATNAGDAHDEDVHRPRESVDTSMSKTTTNGTSSSGSGASQKSGNKNPYKAYKDFRSRSRDLHRQHRGLMQWRPMRNAQFAKDEAKFAIRRVTKLGALDGRQPDVETEV